MLPGVKKESKGFDLVRDRTLTVRVLVHMKLVIIFSSDYMS